MEVVFYGEKDCGKVQGNGKVCPNKAYYKRGNALYCGVHSRLMKDRKELPKNPDAANLAQDRLAQHRRSIEEAQIRNQRGGLKGSVRCAKLRMMKNPELADGWLNVFPNFKHQNRKDGFGCKSLSPKALGPVVHKQPGLPDALSIENYHQFNKVFSTEVDENGNPTPAFYAAREKAYLDAEPHRHKFSAEQMKAVASKDSSATKNKNVPLYSIHKDDAGNELRFTYVESRAFYCKQYERLACRTPDFQVLKDKLAEGVNLCIVGYDAYAVHLDCESTVPTQNIVSDALYKSYLDDRRPFGHELVLYSLLTLEHPDDYPWNVFVQKHPAIYQGISVLSTPQHHT